VAAFYSFDTSSFLNGRRDILLREVFRSFWSNVEAMIAGGRIRAVDVVRDELVRRGEADVHAWAINEACLFVSLSDDVQLATKQVLRVHPKRVGVGVGGQRNGADPFVIGLANARTGIVVTGEIPSGRLETPRIPDVCEALGIPWRTLVGVARDEGWTF
jgi:hypothetical protein